MQIILGPFHPHLEEALVAEVRRRKAADPLYPLLLLVPSEQIRRRLQVLLTLEQGLSLLAISILTFHQLSKRLCQEGHPGGDFSTGSGLFFEERLRLFIRQNAPTDALLSQLDETEGGVAALWHSLRDLKDGLVDPDLALAALSEGQFGKDAVQNLRPLFVFYRRMENEGRAQSLLSYGDLAAMAIPWVPESTYLKNFGRILYYGFYDLTQVQVDLFQAVARHHETTLFFPLAAKNSGWDYAKRFYERHVEGLVNRSEHVIDLSAKGLPGHNLFDERESEDRRAGPVLSIFNCFDARDEVLTAAKEILRRVSDEGLAFHEIGVVAREIETYLPDIKTLFESHAIPYTTQAEESLIQFPYAKNVLLLLTLRLKDYPRAQVIDLLTSPDFQADPLCGEAVEISKAEWDALSRQAGVIKGLAAWQALKKPRLSSTKQAELLLKIVEALAADLDAIPTESAWTDYAQRFKALLQTYLAFSPPEKKATDLIQDDAAQDAAVQAAVAALFDTISDLDRLGPHASLQGFVETFARWMARETIPAAGQATGGVSLLGAMAARGLSFSHLFLLGMNEGRFPRSIREDPFLPDAQRRVLETVLGYKVGENLAAYDEERLLLTLLVDSAQKGLVAFYHRVDAEGSTASPSWALRKMAQALRPQEEVHVERTMPRSLQARYALSPFMRFDLLPPPEAAFRCALSGADPQAMIGALSLSAALYRQGRAALREIEAGGALGGFDGLITSPIDSQNLNPSADRKTLNPTRLERYALCPFKSFALDVLNLGPIERPEDQSELAMSELGTLCHAILHRFFAELHRDRYFEGRRQGADWRARLETICAEASARFELEHPVAYPLFWNEMKDQIAAFLRGAIAIDLQELAASGFRPTAFEQSFCTKIEAEWPEMAGRIDRLDVHPLTKAVRAVDYKITFRRQAKPLEKNLLLSALRGERLQAPIYQKLARTYGEAGGDRLAAFYFIAPLWSDGPLVVREFPEAAWEGEGGALLRETIGGLLSGMAAGHFFIDPGEHCRYCPVASICRKEHLPSRRRLERDPLWTQHRLRRQHKFPSNNKGKAE